MINLQLHSTMLPDAQMEAVTTCKEFLEGDMVGGTSCLSSQISWTAGSFTLIGNVTKVEDITDYKKVRAGIYILLCSIYIYMSVVDLKNKK